MPGMVVEPDEGAVAVEQATTNATPATFRPRVRRSRLSPLEIESEPSAEVRAAERRAARRVFRLYCVACGRSSEGATAPQRLGRCPTCGGTMLLELAGD
jgi:hypothetical protein